MRATGRLHPDVGQALLCLVMICLGPYNAHASPPFMIFHRFSSTDVNNKNIDGIRPFSGLIFGKDGFLYGTTSGGGAGGCGIIFRITPGGILSVLHSFAPPGKVSGRNTDGAGPFARLAEGPDGALYGVTVGGGANGSGTVFQVTPEGALTILHSFAPLSKEGSPNADGALPDAGLVWGADHRLYGTTEEGGSHGLGTVFAITPSGELTTLYSFGALGSVPESSPDGAYPDSVLALGKDGSLYGTTQAGGANKTGTLFKITSAGVLTTLHRFGAMDSNGKNADGSEPSDGLVVTDDGALFGVTASGGANGRGTVFKITPNGDFTTLHHFSDWMGDQHTNSDGCVPRGGLMQGRDGNLYGTTCLGGANGSGTVYQITPAGVLTNLYSFSATSRVPHGSGESPAGLEPEGTNADGAYPEGRLTEGPDGALYGTTDFGGPNKPVGGTPGGCGTVFKLTLRPVIESFMPTPAGIGASVKVVGANFASVTAVKIGELPAHFTIESDTALTLTVPEGSKSAPITVTNPFGTGAGKRNLEVTR